MASSLNSNARSGLLGRVPHQLVSEPLSPVTEGDEEPSSSSHGFPTDQHEDPIQPAAERRFQTIEGNLSLLNVKIDRILDKLSKSENEGEHSPNIQFMASSSNLGINPHLSNVGNSINCNKPANYQQAEPVGIQHGSKSISFSVEKINHIPGHINTGSPSMNAKNNNQTNGSQRNQPNLRLKMPDYDGLGDVEEWLLRLNHYFNYYFVPDWDKVRICSVQLKGKDAHWFDWLVQMRGSSLSWGDFCQAIKVEYGPSQFTNYVIDLKNLKQEGVVQEYDSQFQQLSKRVQGFTEPCLVSHYIGGLKEEIRYEVMVSNPLSLPAAMQTARLFEAKYTALKKISRNNQYQYRVSGNSWGTLATNHASNPVGASTGNTFKQYPSISPSELGRRKSLGQCFLCEEKWFKGHRCKEKKLYMLTSEIEDLEDIQEDEDPQKFCIPGSFAISLQALSGSLNHSTMKLQGTLNNRPVLILIDSGSTHSFVDIKFRDKVGLELSNQKEFEVMVANGSKLKSRGLCEGVNIHCQGKKLVADLLLLPITGCQVVLGVNWLSTLGDITWNFKHLTMRYELQGREHILQGMDTQSHSLMEPLNKDMRQNPQVFLIQLCSIDRQQSTSTGKSSKVSYEDPEVRQLLQRYEHLFDEINTLPPKRPYDHQIPLVPGALPVCSRPYRHAYIHKNEIEKQVKEMLHTGIIRPSNSPYSSPVILVKKSYGSWRMCIDYRALNLNTVKDKFPIPFIEELFDELNGATYFSKLDLRSGYHQVRMNEGDIHKTAFRTHQGHYEFVVMPFGLTNAPSTFQAMMNDIFKDYLRKFVLVFFDDILVYSPHRETHFEHLSKVLQQLEKYQLRIKRSKCFFFQEQVDYLGHVISNRGVEVDHEKIQAVLQWPIPGNLKELRGFLGLTGYYRRFVKGYGCVAGALTALLKKNAFQWSPKAQEAFEQLKMKLTQPPALRMPDFSKLFMLECDASGEGIGAVLMQENKPLAYLSQTLKGTTTVLSTYEKEMLAILLAVKKWKQYLWGREFLIRTDHKSLKYMLEQKVHSDAQYKWILKLHGFHYKVEYKKGKENMAADGLSRRPECLMAAVSVVVAGWLPSFKLEMQGSPYYQKKRDEWEQGKLNTAKYSMQDGLLYYKNRLLIDPDSNFTQVMLKEHHDMLQAGHSGVAKTLHRLKKVCYWKGMKTSVYQYVQQCDICQRNKSETMSPAGLLQL